MKVETYRDELVSHWGYMRTGGRFFLFLGKRVVEVELWKDRS